MISTYYSERVNCNKWYGLETNGQTHIILDKGADPDWVMQVINIDYDNTWCFKKIFIFCFLFKYLDVNMTKREREKERWEENRKKNVSL